MREFIEDILRKDYPNNFEDIFNNSPLLQYLDCKMGAIYGNSKTRRSLANIYAIYSILYFYSNDFYNQKELYKRFSGYPYTKLFAFCRQLYGGEKLQNHALNSRVNGEFKNKENNKDLIIIDNGKYALHIDFLYVKDIDISKTAIAIIQKYIQLLQEKDYAFVKDLEELKILETQSSKLEKLITMLTEKSEARVFEIISYAILKNHYKGIQIYWGYSPEQLQQETLTLYKTGRTNANDGGIDFVMKPLGRFFQVTEVLENYDKYLLDIDKVMHFPITFVVKTFKTKISIEQDLDNYIQAKSGGMEIIIKRYKHAIEEIITINELKEWMRDLSNDDINSVINDIEMYYKLEMNLM
ncbi:MAG: restriction endonuclease [Alphaproteobacteria bacterium]|nr:restriction endonuclease [Alphaproteobacteria bacterium]